MDTLSLSSRAGLLKPSPTLGITAKAQAMRAEGKDVISLAAGEPDFDTPAPVNEAAIAAINSGFTKYTPSAGAKDLREAIAKKITDDHGVSVDFNQVIVSCGAKHSLYNTMMMLLDAGDEVLVFAPYWMTYIDQIRLAGGVPVVVHTSAAEGFVPSPESIRAAVTPRTKMIVVNSPSNPTGAVYPAETLDAIGKLAVEKGLWVVSDEIYEKLVYEGKHLSFMAQPKEVLERTILINGCSKTYAMTGWRVGFAYAPLMIAKAMSNFQDQVTSNPSSISQKAAIAAFRMPEDAVTAMRDTFAKRRDLIVGLLKSIPGVITPVPKGAFYVFPDFSAHLKGRTDLELAGDLLDAGVATIPGSVFEGTGHLRLSYAASEKDIERGVARIAGALGKGA